MSLNQLQLNNVVYKGPPLIGSIESGTESTVIDCGGRTPLLLLTPDNLNSNKLTLQGSDSASGPFRAFQASTSSPIDFVLDVQASANGRFIELSANLFVGINFFKVITSASETDKQFKFFTYPV